MKIVIVEDEKPAANRLAKLLQDHSSDFEIVAKLDSVKKSVEWFGSNSEIDLVFMDIQLADGLSFEVFEHVEITAPVIFTTAYDEYALKAFKVNSVDYLLKPVDIDDISKALNKLDNIRKNNSEPSQTVEQIANAMQMLTSKYKNRFLVKTGEHIKSIAVDDIIYFFSRDKASFCQTSDHKNYLLDYSLEQIENMLNPERFFRINRKYIITLESIKDIISYSNSRLKIVFTQPVDEDVVVSRDRVADFKQWLDR